MAHIFARPMVLALAVAGMALPYPSAAQMPGSYFTAQLASPTVQARVMAGGVVWRCTGVTCTAPRAPTRPLRMCRDLQREAGAVISFAIEGIAMDETELARCNA